MGIGLYGGWVCVAVLILAVGLSPLKLELTLDHAREGGEILLRLKLFFGLVRVSLARRLKSVQGEEPSLAGGDTGIGQGEGSPTLVEHARGPLSRVSPLPLVKALLLGLSHTSCRGASWYTYFGTRDAALTGMGVGLLWTAKSLLLGLASRYLRFKEPVSYGVIPCFHEERLRTRLHCILSIRLGYAIFAITRLLWTYWRDRDRGREG